jgi:3-hydroxyisobutyrate dehydrogenase
VRLGWIGTGIMGRPMCAHLLDAGHELSVATRHPDRAAPLVARGAQLVASPGEVAASAEVIFTMVGTPADVRQVLLGASGVVGAARPGSLLIDCTTSSPSLAIEIAEAADRNGLISLDAPVSGGERGAIDGTLSIMVGGRHDGVEAARPLLDLLGSSVVHQGAPGAGQHAKVVNQILIATTMIGVCEGLVYAVSAGLDPESVLASVSSGAAGSWSLSRYAPQMLAGDLAPGFLVEHFVKDLRIALDGARELHLSLPGLALSQQLYEAVVANGGARHGTQALIEVIARLSGRSWPPRRAAPASTPASEPQKESSTSPHLPAS